MITLREFEKLKNKERILKKASEILRVEDKDLLRVVERFQNEIKEMEERIKEKTEL
jgi:alanyl-tRNA synthetase